MHIGLVCPDVTGHQNPMSTIGRELIVRGHRVSLIGIAPSRARAIARGLEFLEIGTPQEAVAIQEGWAVLGGLSGLNAVKHTGILLRQASQALLRDLPKAIEQGRLEGLVIDQFSPAGVIVAERLGLPFVIACNALASHHEDGIPPPPTLFRYREGWIWRKRNWLIAMSLAKVLDRLSGAGLPDFVPPLKLVFETEHGLAQLAQQPAFFDYPRQHLPSHFHYTAPWHEPARDDDCDFPWHRLDGRPLVYASMGTLQNRLQHIFEAFQAAVQDLPVQLVIALGNRESPIRLPAAENVIVVPYAPQLRLLDKAAVAITHAGMNTAIECVARGVPMLCIPVTNDQPGVARRVEYLGLGEVLPVQSVTVKRVRRLLVQLLDNPRYRETARRYQAQLPARSGVALAGDIIEQALVGRTRVIAPARLEAALQVAPAV